MKKILVDKELEEKLKKAEVTSVGLYRVLRRNNNEMSSVRK